MLVRTCKLVILLRTPFVWYKQYYRPSMYSNVIFILYEVLKVGHGVKVSTVSHLLQLKAVSIKYHQAQKVNRWILV